MQKKNDKWVWFKSVLVFCPLISTIILKIRSRGLVPIKIPVYRKAFIAKKSTRRTIPCLDSVSLTGIHFVLWSFKPHELWFRYLQFQKKVYFFIKTAPFFLLSTWQNLFANINSNSIFMGKEIRIIKVLSNLSTLQELQPESSSLDALY